MRRARRRAEAARVSSPPGLVTPRTPLSSLSLSFSLALHPRAQSRDGAKTKGLSSRWMCRSCNEEILPWPGPAPPTRRRSIHSPPSTVHYCNLRSGRKLQIEIFTLTVRWGLQRSTAFLFLVNVNRGLVNKTWNQVGTGRQRHSRVFHKEL